MKHLKESLRHDPDNVACQRALKQVRRGEAGKQEATDLFKGGKFEEAIAKFGECLVIDPLDKSYNSNIYFNRAMGKAWKELAQTKVKEW